MAQPKPSQMDEIQRRMSAAKILGRFDSWVDMAAAIKQKGLGQTTLRSMTDAEVPYREGDLEVIARACGLHPGFFTQPLDQLGAPPAAVNGTAAGEAKVVEISSVVELRDAVRQLEAKLAELQWDLSGLASEVRQPGARSDATTQGRGPQGTP